MKLALLLVFLTHSTIAFAKADKQVTVTGQCTLETTPDRGSINFVAESLSADSKTSIQRATTLHEKLREEFKRSKIKNLELSTSEYQVGERKEWEHNKNVSKGFYARIGLRASTTEIGSLGDLIAIAARVGVKETSELQTYLSEQKTLDEKKKCLEAAARNAREKADTLARSLGSKVGAAIQITEHAGSYGGGQPQPMMEARAMMKSAAADMASPTIEGRKLTLQQEIEVIFALE